MCSKIIKVCKTLWYILVSDSAGSRPWDKGGPVIQTFDREVVSQDIFFWPFRPHQFGLKIRGGPGPPGLLPWIRHCPIFKPPSQLWSSLFSLYELLMSFRMDLLKLFRIIIFICVFEYSILRFWGECKLKFRCKHANGIQNAYSPIFSAYCKCGQTYLP